MRTIAVVLAGGTGTRIGGDAPKQLVEIAGVPLIEHTIRSLHAVDAVDEIVVVMAAGHTDVIEAMRDRYPKLSMVVDGGATRADSSRLALAALAAEDPDVNVLLHDAARPFVSARIVTECVEALASYDAVCVAVPAADTVIEVDGDLILASPDRSRLRYAQTPQGFRLSTIRKAYAAAAADPDFAATDDSGVVLRYLPDTPIHVVAGDERNVKVTHPVDLLLGEALIDGDR
ncbi:MAG: ribitol-5-phosphate 2-dehydrogenase / D-ribitol-5-phosphate cytidylyltransferase [Frankiales bacterium]|nr:ribitol-5-phosphate 2-dehydrogenase / D-ribitol-5-phosphate cytidylyltransferase [Frankiales bacterium]